MSRSTVSRRFALIATIGVQACGEAPGGPNLPPPAPVYDLLYESFLSSAMLLQSIDGGQPIAPVPGVTRGIDPTATIDGRYIAFVLPDSANFNRVLTVHDRVTGISRTLGRGDDVDEQPAFSPDGQRIAFVSTVETSRDVYVMNRDGTDRRKLTTDVDRAVIFDFKPVWSPDGKQIAWSSNEHGQMNVWIMNADGSNKHRLTNNSVFEDDPVFSPDGTRIAFFEVKLVGDRTATNLVIVNTDGSNHTIVPTLAGGSSRHPAWSPDGALLAFTFIPTVNARPQIYTMKPDGTELKLRSIDALNRGGQHAAFIRR